MQTVREEIFASQKKTPFRLTTEQALASLQPNSKLQTYAVSRNIPLKTFTDSVQHFEIPGDDGVILRFYLHHIEATASDWVLTFVTLPDYNQPSTQAHKPNTPRML